MNDILIYEDKALTQLESLLAKFNTLEIFSRLEQSNKLLLDNDLSQKILGLANQTQAIIELIDLNQSNIIDDYDSGILETFIIKSINHNQSFLNSIKIGIDQSKSFHPLLYIYLGLFYQTKYLALDYLNSNEENLINKYENLINDRLEKLVSLYESDNRVANLFSTLSKEIYMYCSILASFLDLEKKTLLSQAKEAGLFNNYYKNISKFIILSPIDYIVVNNSAWFELFFPMYTLRDLNNESWGFHISNDLYLIFLTKEVLINSYNDLQSNKLNNVLAKEIIISSQNNSILDIYESDVYINNRIDNDLLTELTSLNYGKVNSFIIYLNNNPQLANQEQPNKFILNSQYILETANLMAQLIVLFKGDHQKIFSSLIELITYNELETYNWLRKQVSCKIIKNQDVDIIQEYSNNIQANFQADKYSNLLLSTLIKSQSIESI